MMRFVVQTDKLKKVMDSAFVRRPADNDSNWMVPCHRCQQYLESA